MTSLSDLIRAILSTVAGIAILGSLVVIQIGIGGRSPRTPTPLESLGYEGPIWGVLLLALVVLFGGIGLTLALKRSQGGNATRE